MHLRIGSRRADTEERAVRTVNSYISSHSFSRVPLTCSLFLLVLSIITMATAALGAEQIHRKSTSLFPSKICKLQ